MLALTRRDARLIGWSFVNGYLLDECASCKLWPAEYQWGEDGDPYCYRCVNQPYPSSPVDMMNWSDEDRGGMPYERYAAASGYRLRNGRWTRELSLDRVTRMIPVDVSGDRRVILDVWKRLRAQLWTKKEAKP